MADKEMVNPITKKPLNGFNARRVTDLRKIRSNARKDARSGHPGRRASGISARGQAAALIGRVYLDDAEGKAR